MMAYKAKPINQDFIKFIGQHNAFGVFGLARYLGEVIPASDLKAEASKPACEQAFKDDASRNWWDEQYGLSADQVLGLLPQEIDAEAQTDNIHLLKVIAQHKGKFSCGDAEQYSCVFLGPIIGLHLNTCDPLQGGARKFSIKRISGRKDFTLICSQQHQIVDSTDSPVSTKAPDIASSAEYAFEWKDDKVVPQIRKAKIEFLNQQAYNKVRLRVLATVQNAQSLADFDAPLFAAAFLFFDDEQIRTEFIGKFLEKLINAEDVKTLPLVINNFLKAARLFFDDQNYPGQFNQLAQDVVQELLNELTQVRLAQTKVVVSPVAGPAGISNPHLLLTRSGNKHKELQAKEERLRMLAHEMCKSAPVENCAAFLQAMIPEHLQLAQQIFIARMECLPGQKNFEEDEKNKMQLAKAFFVQAHAKLSLKRFNGLLDAIAKTVCCLENEHNKVVVQGVILDQLALLPSTDQSINFKERFGQSLIVHAEVARLKSTSLTTNIHKHFSDKDKAGAVTSSVRKAGNAIEKLWEQVNKEELTGNHIKAGSSRKQVVALCKNTHQAIANDGKVDYKNCQRLAADCTRASSGEKTSTQKKTIWQYLSSLFARIFSSKSAKKTAKTIGITQNVLTVLAEQVEQENKAGVTSTVKSPRLNGPGSAATV